MKKKQEIILKALSTIVYREIERQNLKKTLFCYENGLTVSMLYGFLAAKRDISCTRCITMLLDLGVDMGDFGKYLREEMPEYELIDE